MPIIEDESRDKILIRIWFRFTVAECLPSTTHNKYKTLNVVCPMPGIDYPGTRLFEGIF